MDEQDLLDLKQKIEKAKQDQERLKARKEVLTEQLSKDWKVSTPAQAKKKIDSMKAELEELEEQIQEETEKLKDQLEDGTD
jgi:transposase